MFDISECPTLLHRNSNRFLENGSKLKKKTGCPRWCFLWEVNSPCEQVTVVKDRMIMQIEISNWKIWYLTFFLDSGNWCCFVYCRMKCMYKSIEPRTRVILSASFPQEGVFAIKMAVNHPRHKFSRELKYVSGETSEYFGTFSEMHYLYFYTYIKVVFKKFI